MDSARRREYKRQWEREHPRLITAKRRTQLRTASRKWNAKHPEILRTAGEKWLANHLDRRREVKRAYRAREREIRQYQRRCKTSTDSCALCFDTGCLLLKGWRVSEIASALQIPERTVKSYLWRLCKEYKVARDGLRYIKLAVKLYEYPLFRGE